MVLPKSSTEKPQSQVPYAEPPPVGAMDLAFRGEVVRAVTSENCGILGFRALNPKP